MSALPWQSVSSPILILNLHLLKVQPGHELSREPFIRAVRVYQKLYLYKWLLLRLMQAAARVSRGLFSPV